MLFLPVGYPESTKENYLKYTLLAALAHFFMNTSATIGSTFLLYAAGLGRAEAQIAASAFNWIIKDLGGQGGVIIATLRECWASVDTPRTCWASVAGHSHCRHANDALSGM